MHGATSTEQTQALSKRAVSFAQQATSGSKDSPHSRPDEDSAHPPASLAGLLKDTFLPLLGCLWRGLECEAGVAVGVSKFWL